MASRRREYVKRPPNTPMAEKGLETTFRWGSGDTIFFVKRIGYLVPQPTGEVEVLKRNNDGKP